MSKFGYAVPGYCSQCPRCPAILFCLEARPMYRRFCRECSMTLLFADRENRYFAGFPMCEIEHAASKLYIYVVNQEGCPCSDGDVDHFYHRQIMEAYELNKRMGVGMEWGRR